MNKGGCILYPEVNGKASSLYKELLAYTKDRELTNYLYALYTSSDMADKMDSMGYARNDQGEHSLNDLKKTIDILKFREDSKTINIDKAARTLGAIDANGLRIEFTDAQQALDKAKDFNDHSDTMVATVFPKGDNYVIMVDGKNSHTYQWKEKNEQRLAVWDITKQIFQDAGIDVTDPALFNPNEMNAYNSEYLWDTFHFIESRDNKYLSKSDLKKIFVLNANDAGIQRLVSMFGGVDEAIDKVYDSYRNPNDYTSGQHLLIGNTLDTCKKISNVIDMARWENEIANVYNNYTNTVDADIKDTLDNLNKKWHIDKVEIHRKNAEIRKMSDSVAEAMVTLQRQIDAITRQQGITQEAKDMSDVLHMLNKALQNKRYYISSLKFLEIASDMLGKVDAALQAAMNYSGTTVERQREMASVLMQLHNYEAGYRHVLESLYRNDELYSEDNWSADEVQAIKDKAKDLLDYLDNNRNKIKDLERQFACDVFTDILGAEIWNGVSVIDLVEMATKDTSFLDTLYSYSRCSDPLVASMSGILDDARKERDKIVMRYAQRIEALNRKLREAGYRNTDFMYEEDGHIVSDIDWVAYYNARGLAIATFKQHGLYGVDLKLAIQNWEENNSEDRVVDQSNGRTERVPNGNYRKPFPTLTAEQQAYYDAMMAIKGELGSMLPAYAQRHYSPPQVRISNWESLKAAFKKDGTKGVLKRLKKIVSEAFTIKEDNTDYADNGVIVDGGEFSIAVGDMDNTLFRQIPIFYVNRLKNQEDLTHDFTTAIHNFMATACNYKLTSQVRDTLEVLSNYLLNKNAANQDTEHNSTVEVVEGNAVRVFKDVYKKGRANRTSDLIEGFMSVQLYGNKARRNAKERFAKAIIAYTSVRNLALNVKGWIANWAGGMIQDINEGVAGEFYNLKDFGWAMAKLTGDGLKDTPGDLLDAFMGQYDTEKSKAELIAQMFNPLGENYDKNLHKRYNESLFAKIISGNYTFIGYQTGEYIIHMLTAYSILNNRKLTKNGKQISLYDALIRTQNSEGEWSLELDQDAEYTDENGVVRKLDQAYIDKVARDIEFVNQQNHGAMNDADKGKIHDAIWGKALMNMRQWMVEFYSKRFRFTYYDAKLKQNREGYNYTMYHWLKGMISTLRHVEMDSALHWSEMSKMQKSNVRRFFADWAMIASLFTLSMALGEPDDHKREFWYRMWIYQTKRMHQENLAGTPIGAVTEFGTMVNSPIAATNTMNSLIYPIYGIKDINKTVKTGRYKGWNKYVRNVTRYTVPFWNQLDQLYNMDTEESVFSMFDKNPMQK